MDLGHYPVIPLAIVLLLTVLLVTVYFLFRALIAFLVFLTIALIDLVWDHTPNDTAKADQQWL